MTWLEYHRRSERYASDAEVFALHGDEIRAQQLYAKAAEAEELALSEIGVDKPRTYGVTAVSTVALYFKATEWSAAQTLAYRCLGSGHLPEFAWGQVEDLLDSIKMRQVGIDFDNTHMLVSARGGEIVTGGAPWDLILPKIENMVALLYRTTEYMKNCPHRRRGRPSKEIQESYQPWLFQTAPGSYQFAVSLQQIRQLSMFDDDIQPKQVTDRLFGILQACATSPREELTKVVPDDDYRGTFLKLTRDLAPTKKGRFTQLDIRAASEAHPIILRSDIRHTISGVLREKLMPPPDTQKKDIRGVLRALHLDRDWIEVVTHEGAESCRIDRAGDEVDDRIGPMVNRPVVVQVAQVGERLNFIDIEADE